MELSYTLIETKTNSRLHYDPYYKTYVVYKGVADTTGSCIFTKRNAELAVKDLNERNPLFHFKMVALKGSDNPKNHVFLTGNRDEQEKAVFDFTHGTHREASIILVQTKHICGIPITPTTKALLCLCIIANVIMCLLKYT
jgi:hypothetical protein